MHTYRKTSDRIGFNVNHVLFGELPFRFLSKFVNYKLLYFNLYIFTCLKQNKNLTFVLLLHYLLFTYKVENY